jgi:hypothetical protein
MSVEAYRKSGLYKGKTVSRTFVLNQIRIGKPLPNVIKIEEMERNDGKSYVLTVEIDNN